MAQMNLTSKKAYFDSSDCFCRANNTRRRPLRRAVRYRIYVCSGVRKNEKMDVNSSEGA